MLVLTLIVGKPNEAASKSAQILAAKSTGEQGPFLEYGEVGVAGWL